MAKNLVVLLDGTGNKFDEANSNIVKLLSMLEQNSSAQLCYYSAGVGTFGLAETLFEWQRVPAKILGLAFGWGIPKTAENAYRFLMDNYEEGDRVFILGFSRGAYTARVLAGMLKAIGLLRAQIPNQFDYGFKLMQKLKGKRKDRIYRLMSNFKALFSRPCRVSFLGLFDTVKTVGWIYSPFSFPYTASNDNVAIVRHAVSLDERRCLFRQNLWSPASGQDVKEVWFAGVHSDVGGGYPDAESGLSKYPLCWMARECVQAGLLLDQSKCEAIIYGANYRKGGGSTGPTPDAVQHESLRGWWWLPELLPRLSRDASSGYKQTMVFPIFNWLELGRRRKILRPIAIHRSVSLRLNAGIGYQPPQLPEGHYFVD
jgi:uncharacterized protein (DUF2235 family)